MSLLSYVFAVLAGTSNPLQAGSNAQLNKSLGSPLWATLFVYASGLMLVGLIQLVVRQAFPQQAGAAAIPWWAWAGGCISIISTLAGLMLAQKMGSGLYTGLNLTAALLSSIVLDTFGLMGFKPHALTSLRMAGAAFLIAGIWMIAKS